MTSSMLAYAVRLLAAMGVGIAIGFNRDLEGKPIGMRTLALVSLGAAIVCLATINYIGLNSDPAAVSRVLQGNHTRHPDRDWLHRRRRRPSRSRRSQTVHGLTTAASVWVTAALGIACALGAWSLVLLGTAATVFILVLLRWLEGLFGSFEK